MEASVPARPSPAIVALGAIVAALLTILLALMPHDASAPGGSGAATLDASYGQLPLSFSRHGGEFVAATAAGTVSLDARGATLSPVARDHGPVTIAVVGGAEVAPRAIERLPGVINYYRGDDPSMWRTGVHTFARVRYAGVYPGIDLDYHGTSGTLEYDYRLAPGADPAAIAMRFRGAPVHVSGGGRLVIGRGGSALRLDAPKAYQGTAAVDSAFTLTGRTVGFDLGAYDHSRPLVIDPLVLSYSTYLGGTDQDFVNDVAVDNDGNLFLTGQTTSGTGFPLQGGFDHGHGGVDAFVTKLNPTGTALVWSSIIGGADNDDWANSIALDRDGASYIAGRTNSTDYPHTAGALVQNVSMGAGDGFVSKITSSGSLERSTFLGGSSADFINSIAVDAGGAAYVTGVTRSTHPTPSNPEWVAFPTAHPAIPEPNDTTADDAFISKIDPTFTGLVYSTYLGGTSNGSTDHGTGVAVDSSGQAVIVGHTTTNFIPLGTQYQVQQSTSGGERDGWLIRMTPNGENYNYATYFGGFEDNEFPADVAVDTSGFAYMVGSTTSAGSTDDTGPNSSRIPFKNGYQHASTSASSLPDAFLAKFDPSSSGESSLVFSTALGGNQEAGNIESANSVAIGTDGSVTVGGVTTSPTGFPRADPLPGSASTGSAFVTRFVPAGNALTYSTTLPTAGSVGTTIEGIALSCTTGDVYIGGHTISSGFPTTTGAFDTTYGGNTDGFASKLSFSGGGSPAACPSGATPPGGTPPGETPPEETPPGQTPPGETPAADTTAPDTTITKPPPAKVKTKRSKVTVSYSFTSTEPGTFACSVDRGPFASCTSPRKVELSKGKHTVSVRATDSAGNGDASPATAKVEVKKKKRKRRGH